MIKPKSPFKDKALLIYEITTFLAKHRSYIASQANRISDYFEMSAYNSIVRFYENNGYHVQAVNLFNGSFKYKLSPTGYPERFSYFVVQKEYNFRGGKKHKYEFEIHHNLAVESSIDKGIYTTPDISVISKGGIKSLRDYRYFFSGHRAYYYACTESLQTFCEVKNLNPFPELLFNFTGLVSEIMNEVFLGKESNSRPKHIGPSLMLSGNGNYHTRKIQKTLTDRLAINIFFGLFFKAAQPFSRYYSKRVIKIGSR